MVLGQRGRLEPRAGDPRVRTGQPSRIIAPPRSASAVRRSRREQGRVGCCRDVAGVTFSQAIRSNGGASCRTCVCVRVNSPRGEQLHIAGVVGMRAVCSGGPRVDVNIVGWPSARASIDYYLGTLVEVVTLLAADPPCRTPPLKTTGCTQTTFWYCPSDINFTNKTETSVAFPTSTTFFSSLHFSRSGCLR